MMGDGVIDLRGIRGMVEAAGYHGLIEVEIMSRLDWWQRDPDAVLRMVQERFASECEARPIMGPVKVRRTP